MSKKVRRYLIIDLIIMAVITAVGLWVSEICGSITNEWTPLALSGHRQKHGHGKNLRNEFHFGITPGFSGGYLLQKVTLILERFLPCVLFKLVYKIAGVGKAAAFGSFAYGNIFAS